MYFMDFINSITLLQAQAPPIIPKVEKENVIYSGYEKSEKLEPGLRKMLPEKSEMAMVYIVLPELKKGVLDITDVNRYLQELTANSVVSERFDQISASEATAIVYEAIWLFDILSELPNNKSFICEIRGGLQQLRALCTKNADEDSAPILDYFSSLLDRDIFWAQCMYFIVQYINVRARNTAISTENNIPRDLNEMIVKQIELYSAHYSYMGWKSKIVTGIDNTEFDDFIQQLASLGTAWEKSVLIPEETAGGST